MLTTGSDTQLRHSLTTDQMSTSNMDARKVWGDHSEEDITQVFSAMFEEVVYWRRNIFLVPSGAAGKQYIKETTRLIRIWNSRTVPLEHIALKAIMTMPALLLQKPSYKSSAKQHSQCLSRRLTAWQSGDFNILLKEARSIQASISTTTRTMSQEHFSRTFAKLMLAGKVNAAMRLLDKESSSGVLALSSDVLDKLQSKHPDASPAPEEVLIHGDLPFFDSVMFSALDESIVTQAALRARGASGPSGLDADGWRRILLSKNFGSA